MSYLEEQDETLKYIYTTKKYTKTDIVIYFTINYLSSKYGYCYSTNQWLAKDSNVSERSVKRSLIKLEKDGFILTEISNTGKLRRISLTK